MPTFRDPTTPDARPDLLRLLADALGEQPSTAWSATILASSGAHHRCYRLSDGARTLMLRCAASEAPEWRRSHGLHDAVREYRILTLIEGCPVATPRLLAVDAGGTCFGTPAAILTWLPGTALPHFLDAANRSYVADYAELLGTISRITPRDDLSAVLPVWTLARIVDWLGERSRHQAGDALRERALTWLHQHRPRSRPLHLCHGDPNPSNVLVQDGRISGLVDWEFACLKDDPLDELTCVGWLYRDPALHQVFCAAMGREAHELRWFLVRSWFGSAFTQTVPDPGEQAQARQALEELL